MKRSLLSAGQVAVLVVGVAIVAFVARGESGIQQATLWLVLGLFAVSVSLLWGYAGLLSFGQAAFFGLGAFCYAWATTDTLLAEPLAWNPALIGCLLSILLPVLVALAIGYFLFYGKVVGAYFTIVTLALSFLLGSLGQGWTKVFGGFTGIAGVPTLSIDIGVGTFALRGAWSSYVFAAVVLLLVVALLSRMLATPFGLAVDGVRDNEPRLQYLGMSVVKVKLATFVTSAGIAGLAGALFAAESNYVASDMMGPVLSTEAVIWVAVGGRRSLIGAVLGAVLVRAGGYVLSGIAIDYWMLFLGGLLLALVLLGSTGVVGILQWLLAKVSARKDRGREAAGAA